MKEFAALLFQAVFKQHDLRPDSKPIEPPLCWLVKYFLKCMNEIKTIITPLQNCKIMELSLKEAFFMSGIMIELKRIPI